MNEETFASGTPTRAATPRADQVRAQLNRLLDSGRLNSSEHRRAFLRFIVEETLEGRAEELKGFSIAVEVYGRDESFDAQADPVVRLEARRLRRDLDSYYVDAGASDPIRISIPKGAYVPRFEWRNGATGESRPGAAPATDHAAATARSGRFSRHALIGVALVTAMLVLLAVSWNRFENRVQPTSISGPEVLVLPFRGSGADRAAADLASDVTYKLIDNLMKFEGFRVFAPRGDPARLEQAFLQRVVSNDVPGYVVNGNVDVQGDLVLVAARLSVIETGEVIWSNRWERETSPAAIVDVQRDLAGTIATELGQPYGIVLTDSVRESSQQEVSNLPSYLCVQRAFAYRRNFDPEQFGPVQACLEHAVRNDPRYSDAWAMLGWLYLDAGRFGFTPADDLQRQFAKAFDAASKAFDLDPSNTTALKSLSAISHYMGRFDEAERLARRALELNPNDPDTLAQLGWRLAARGNFDEGIPALEQAVERSLNPPSWYFCMIAVDQLRREDYDGVLETTRRSANEGCGLTPVLSAIANARLGRANDTREALRQLSSSELITRNPMAFFHLHGFKEELGNRLTTELEEARALAASGRQNPISPDRR